MPGNHPSQAAFRWVDCIGTGFPQFPCALVQMRYSIGENGCGDILMGVTLAVRKEVTGDKKGKAKKRGKTWGIHMYKASSHTSGNTNKRM